MTAREIYEHTLTELNKVSAPSILLEDFNYSINKAIHQFGNKRYNVYDKNQQTTDDLRVLTSKAILKEPNLKLSTDYGSPLGGNSMYDSIFVADLPDDYWHILNCICDYELTNNVGCLKKGTRLQYRARRLTADIWPEIIDNYYFKPKYDRPYYYLNGFGESKEIQYNSKQSSSLIQNGQISLKAIKASQTPQPISLGNPNKIQMEIRYGSDIKRFVLKQVFIDYLKVPQTINLTPNELDLVDDKSQVLEFPDYVCFEIINELVKLLLENSRNPRLETLMPVNQSIAPPAQQETKK